MRRTSAVHAAFIAYALAWAGGVLVSNLLIEVGHDEPTAYILNGALGVAFLGSLIWLAALSPTRATRADAIPAALAVLIVAIATILWPEEALNLTFWPSLWGKLSYALYGVAHWGVLLYFALRWRVQGDADRRSVTLMSAALVLWPSFTAGDTAIGSATTFGAVGALALPLALAAIWLAHATAANSAHASRIAWLTLAGALAAMIERALATGSSDLWGYGLTRLAGVAILGYAIVQHQLLGLDVKLRFAISKSTVAAVFIAVFFVASEAAQQFLGETLGSTYVGIIAAGALVFAMAPLQRVAERLAEKAVPVTSSHSETRLPAVTASAGRPERAYRLAVLAALADGAMTPEEEMHLAQMADELQIAGTDALRIRRAAAEEVARG